MTSPATTTINLPALATRAKLDRGFAALIAIVCGIAVVRYALAIELLAATTHGFVAEVPYLVVPCALLTVAFTTVRSNAFAATLSALLFAIVLSMPLACETGYAVHFLGRFAPLADPALLAIDRALGYDAIALLRWFAKFPRLTELLRISYERCQWQVCPLIATLLVIRQNARALEFTAANLLAILAAHSLALVAPAMGVWGYLHTTGTMLPAVSLSSQANTVQGLLQVRAAADLTIPVHPLGLVTFPSYHTAAAFLFAWGFWRSPLRWPAFAFNSSVVLASLLHGGHYLSDILAGGALDALCIIAIRWVTPPMRGAGSEGPL